MSIDRLASQSAAFEKIESISLDQWQPPFSGDIDICIKSNGEWYHEGVLFTRSGLVKLFSSLLRKEESDYFLVTPVEKWRIHVEDAPLLVTGMECLAGEGETSAAQVISFETATGDHFRLDPGHPLRWRASAVKGELKPYILVRSGLEALIHRNVYYHLVQHAEGYRGKLGVWSGGEFWLLEG